MLGSNFTPPVTLAIGPEGGLEEGEMEELVAAGFLPVGVGGNILRFETAAVAALAIARCALQLREAPHGN